jgi:hypothetical protein
VKRHRKQFEWLEKRFEEKYPNICVPALFHKSLADRGILEKRDEENVNAYQLKLDLWINKVCSHPVLRENEALIHFLGCQEVGDQWKSGKRKAEKDEIKGTNWFKSVAVPKTKMNTVASIRDRVSTFSKTAIKLDNCFKLVNGDLEKIASYHSNQYKKELHNMGTHLVEFGNVLSLDSFDAPDNVTLSKAITCMGECYNQVAELYAVHSRDEDSVLLDKMEFMRNVVKEMPRIAQYELNALDTYEELQKKPEKLKGIDMNEVTRRREVISNVTLAEIHQFNTEKVDDLHAFLRTFLRKQVTFYSKMVECFKNVSNEFERIPNKKKNHF